jgi:hypothetical protein
MRDIEDIRDTGYIGVVVYLCENAGAVGIVLGEGEGILCTRRASISLRVKEEGSNQRAKRRVRVRAEGINLGQSAE